MQSINENTCRSCLKNDDSILHSLYDEKIRSLFELSAVTVNLMDDHPKNICDKCHETLFRWYWFRERVLRNDLILTQSSNVEVSVEEIYKLAEEDNLGCMYLDDEDDDSEYQESENEKSLPSESDTVQIMQESVVVIDESSMESEKVKSEEQMDVEEESVLSTEPSNSGEQIVEDNVKDNCLPLESVNVDEKNNVTQDKTSTDEPKTKEEVSGPKHLDTNSEPDNPSPSDERTIPYEKTEVENVKDKSVPLETVGRGDESIDKKLLKIESKAELCCVNNSMDKQKETDQYTNMPTSIAITENTQEVMSPQKRPNPDTDSTENLSTKKTRWDLEPDTMGIYVCPYCKKKMDCANLLTLHYVNDEQCRQKIDAQIAIGSESVAKSGISPLPKVQKVKPLPNGKPASAQETTQGTTVSLPNPKVQAVQPMPQQKANKKVLPPLPLNPKAPLPPLPKVQAIQKQQPKSNKGNIKKTGAAPSPAVKSTVYVPNPRTNNTHNSVTDMRHFQGRSQNFNNYHNSTNEYYNYHNTYTQQSYNGGFHPQQQIYHQQQNYYHQQNYQGPQFMYNNRPNYPMWNDNQYYHQ